MITTKTNLQLDAIERNQPEIVMLGSKKYKLRPMTNAVASRVDILLAQRGTELVVTDNPQVLMVNLTKNRTLIPKCLSYMILHSWFKVTFFHWLHWHFLNERYEMGEMFELYKRFSNMNDVGFFFQFMASLQANSRLIKRMSEANTSIIAQELKSEQGATS